MGTFEYIQLSNTQSDGLITQPYNNIRVLGYSNILEQTQPKLAATCFFSLIMY